MNDFSESPTTEARKVASAPQFARRLGIGVKKMKRLFDYSILPSHLLAKTGGQHWRVQFSESEVRQCKAALAVWNVWRRKPSAASSYDRRDEVTRLAIELILAQGKTDAQKIGSPRDRLDRYWDALFSLAANARGEEAVFWKQRLLENPSEHVAGAFILRTAVAEFQSKYGRKPTRKQLANALEISERSIYRPPFDTEALKLAFSERNLAGVKIEEEAEEEATDDARYDQYDRIASTDYAQQHLRQTSKRTRVGEETRRKLRKQKDHSFELAWEEDRVGNTLGGALLLFPIRKLEAKRRIEMVEQEHRVSTLSARRHTRQLRHDSVLRARDETFGARAVGAYVLQRDGKATWWMNFDTRKGCADSASHARHEILRSIAQAKRRLMVGSATPGSFPRKGHLSQFAAMFL